MSLTDLLFSFKGRINRKPWWLATIAAGLAASVVTAIIEIVARSSGHVAIDPVTNQVEPTGILGLLVGVIGLVNMWIAFALSAKRLHDRDRTGWWLIWQLADPYPCRYPGRGRYRGAAGARGGLVCACRCRLPRGLRRFSLAVRADRLPARNSRSEPLRP